METTIALRLSPGLVQFLLACGWSVNVSFPEVLKNHSSYRV